MYDGHDNKRRSLDAKVDSKRKACHRRPSLECGCHQILILLLELFDRAHHFSLVQIPMDGSGEGNERTPQWLSFSGSTSPIIERAAVVRDGDDDNLFL
jgi:hypothetical protein